MSEILTRDRVEDLVADLSSASHDWKSYATPLLAHDAALRAENERLREGLIKDAGLLIRYRVKFATDGMNGRGWDARVHLWADDALKAMGEPANMTMETAEKVMRAALAAPQEEKEVPNG